MPTSRLGSFRLGSKRLGYSFDGGGSEGTIVVPLVLAEATVFNPSVTIPILIEPPVVLAETEVPVPTLQFGPQSVEVPLVLAEVELFDWTVVQPITIEVPLISTETEVFQWFIFVPGEGGAIQYEGVYSFDVSQYAGNYKNG